MSSFATLGYTLASVGFAAFALLQMTVWRSRTHGSLLLPTALVTSVWAAVLALQAARGVVPLNVIFVAEILRDGMWLTFLMRVLYTFGARSAPRWLVVVVYGSIGVVLLAGLVLGVAHDLAAAVESAGAVLIPGALLLSLIGFVLVEQVYRNTRASHEWSIKFLWIGAGAIIVYDFCLYSTALLFRAIPAAMWDARGAANALCLLLLFLGVSRTTSWAPQVFMSRRPALYTLSFIAAGLYMLAMAVAGYYVRVFGGTWGGAGQLLFLFGAVLLLVIVLFSGQARAQFRVFLAKHFSPYRYDYRSEWLRITRTLAEASDSTLAQRVVRALAQVVHSDAGGIWIANEDGIFVPSGGDLAGPDKPVESEGSEFLRFITEREWVTDLDARRRRTTRDPPDLPVPDWLVQVERAWLVVPLLQQERLVAFVAIARPLAPLDLGWEDLDLLRTVGRQAASYIALEQAARKLAQSQQFEAYNRFAAFMMHDLKNLIAQQTLVVENAARHRGNPQFFDDAISTVENSVKRMSRLLEQLRRGDAVGQARRVNLSDLCRETVRRCGDRQPAPVLISKPPDVDVIVSAERLALVLEHVIRNAQDATPPDGSVQVELRRTAERAEIQVLDNGTGMDDAFIRQRLFRPFNTTKGSQGMGIGAFQT
ncbi:MAG TPA: XrtA/PEP-CTERM system histidine kinase PrsK, partial [Steroidobacteraceae bacterium]|nr:XrtA/PEP-CTERM system histidine kinase PrsK [Steroidobacteraceae bacterium]